MPSKDNYFEPEVAQETAERIRCKPSADQPAERPDSGYIRFSSGKLKQGPQNSAPSEPEVAVKPDEPVPVAQSSTSKAWDEILDWAIWVSGANAAFLIDPAGLAIASRGEIKIEEIEGISTRLLVAIEQAGRIHGSASSARVILDCGGMWLTGLPVRKETEILMTIGIRGKQPVERSTGIQIQSLASERLATLR